MSTLVFSPAMAQEAEEVHQQALEVLREQLSRPPTNSFSTRPTIPESRRIEAEIQRDRKERNMLLREQADAERARQNQLHEEKRLQFEQEMREREFLRQRQRDYDESIARQMRALNPGMSTDEVHSQALSVLRGEQPAPAETVPQSAVTPPPAATPATTVPATAATTPAPAVAPAENVVSQEELHQRALEILRSQQGAPQQATTPAPVETRPEPVAVTPAPVQPTPAQPAPAPAPEPAYAQPHLTEVHDQALQVLRQQQVQPEPAPTTRPAPQPSPELRRRMEEVGLARTAPRATPEPTPTPAPAPAPVAAPAQETLPADLEARARQVLRQQQAQVAAAPAATPQPMARPATATAPRSTAVPSNTQANEQYSRELEERARQILEQRAQTQQSATQPAAATPPAATAVTPAPAAVPPPAAASATPAPQPVPEAVHSKAVEVLRQGGGPTGPQPVRTRRDRLRELTELYKADKITSAEYHQQRAKILAEPAD